MSVSLADLRREYTLADLDETQVAADPFEQFKRWFDQALTSKVNEPNAMTLATVSAAGRPTARVVLLKGYDAQGLVFFTNYLSRKGRELAANPHAALNFFWPELERQIRIEGAVSQTSADESDEYFNVRPLASRIGAWASPQSTPIPSRQTLIDAEARLTQSLGDHPERPVHWGGYRLMPDLFEFWQGRPSRLHDRVQYLRHDGVWQVGRLAP